MPKRKKSTKSLKKKCQGEESQVKKQKQCKKDEDVTNKLTVKNCIEDEKALYSAAMLGDDTKLAELLASGVSPEIYHLLLCFATLFPNSTRLATMPLQIAAARGHNKCVEVLIAHGAKLDTEDKYGLTAMHFALICGNFLCFKLLLEAGANCNTSTSVPLISAEPQRYPGGTTALHLAAKLNRAKFIEELIKFGADYTAVDKNNNTSLHLAAKAGFSDCVLAHLRNADCSKIMPVRIPDTPLSLLSYAPLHSLPSFDTLDTPLHYAVEKKNVECVKELVHLGANVNRINLDGDSPLHLLCRDFGKESAIDMEMLEHLVVKGHNTNVNESCAKGVPPLFYLVHSGNIPAIIFLITHGADVNIKWGGITFLEYCLSYTNEEYDILDCILNYVPQLPHLKSFNDLSFPLTRESDYYISKYEIWHDSVLPNNVKLQLLRIGTQLYVEILYDRGAKIDPDDACNFRIVSHRIRYLLQEPLVSLLYKCVSDELEYLKDKSYDFQKSPLSNYDEFDLQGLERSLLYEKIVSTPRPLQLLCRLSIHKHLGKLKHVRELPLPKKLHTYLLYKCEV